MSPSSVLIPCGVCGYDVPDGGSHIDTGTGIMYCAACCPCRRTYDRGEHRCYTGKRHPAGEDCHCYCRPCLRAIHLPAKVAS